MAAMVVDAGIHQPARIGPAELLEQTRQTGRAIFASVRRGGFAEAVGINHQAVARSHLEAGTDKFLIAEQTYRRGRTVDAAYRLRTQMQRGEMTAVADFHLAPFRGPSGDECGVLSGQCAFAEDAVGALNQLLQR